MTLTALSGIETTSRGIDARNVSFRYGRTVALDNVTFATTSGVVGLLGPNGAGKTTLLNLLATLERPTTGTLAFDGRDINDVTSRHGLRTTLGYLPQQCGFFPDFSAESFVRYIAVMRGVSTAEVSDRVAVALERVGLTRLAGQKIRKLSSGQRQRVGIAQAIVNDPRLILLDEPTVGLDPDQRFAFRTLLEQLGTSATIVLSTHLVEDIAFAADEVLVLAGGQVRFLGSPEAMLAHETPDSRGDSPLERGYSALIGTETWSDTHA